MVEKDKRSLAKVKMAKGKMAKRKMPTGESMQKRPNVILICFDQWRGDALSCAGHPVVHTPHLDALAHEGLRFSRAYSATPSCIPARAALFTGLCQQSHGRVGYLDGVPWDYDTTLAGEFTKSGYQTQAIGKMHVYPERSQLGFQHVILHDGFLHYARKNHPNDDYIDDYLPWLRRELGRDADYADHGLSCNSNLARPWDKPEYTHPTNYVVSEAIAFLKRRDPRKPFFLYLSFHRPHPPYDPPAWAFAQYLGQEMPAPPVGDWQEMFAAYTNSADSCSAFGKIGLHRLQRARAGYYGLMTHIDHQVGRFIEELERHGELANSTICAVSDHGELMGDHHLFRKSLPYEGSANIPLILKSPKSTAQKQGETCSVVVELRDIMPTLLDSAGIPIPDSLEGRSLLHCSEGNWREYLHGESTYHLIGDSVQWLTDGVEKYIWFSKTGQEQFFNLKDDPQELVDLGQDAAYKSKVALWQERLVRVLQDREEGFSDGQRLIANRPVSPILRQRRKASESR